MVFVLDRHKHPLMPCTEKRARLLLSRGQAVVHRRAPFTIRLRTRTRAESAVQPVRLKLDPGSKVTGWAVLREDGAQAAVLVLGELVHKPGIKAALESRRSVRRGRRNRKTRYRPPRFLNRGGDKTGWLPPSLLARIQQTTNLVRKVRRLAPVTALSTEHVKFDTQLVENPNITGVEYQQGALAGYEVKEYILERDGRRCAYCQTKDAPLEIEHIVPRSRGGSNRISNLTLACPPCNQRKGNRTAAEYGFPEVQGKTRRSLKDAAAVNATRWRLYGDLQKTGLPVECGTGARTKYQRVQHGLSKQHYFDAACVGASTPEALTIPVRYVWRWAAKGRGNRQMAQPDKYGFPRQYRSRKKMHFGFMTGDLVQGYQPKHKRSVVGRVTCRADGGFYVVQEDGKRVSFTARRTTLLQRGDGWAYTHAHLEKG